MMKHLRLLQKVLLILFLAIGTLASCASEKELRIGVISDIHFLSEHLMDNGSAISSLSESAGRDFTAIPFILDKVLSDYLHSDIDILLISGDMTKDGEKQSHIDLVKKLQPLRDKGIRIYVVPGNHDINMPYASLYKGETVQKAENVDPVEFEQIYADCGYSKALYKDTASLSYVTELSNNIWLVAIDGCRYKEYTNNSISGGKINEHTEMWLRSMFLEAKRKNKLVLGMMHHALVEHFPYQEMLFSQYIIDDWKHYADLFADSGMKAIFTGHFHANDITEYISGEQNKIYDIETGSLTSYAFPYRFVTIRDSGMDVETRNVEALQNKPDLVEHSKKRLEAIAGQLALGKLKSLGVDVNDSIANQIARIAGGIFVLHAAGDEVVTDSLKQQIKELGRLFDQTTPEDDIDDFKIDFFPADNNVKINF
ncbi:MAG: metallophosphoesterase family protein [Dysgonomonas sp.]